MRSTTLLAARTVLGGYLAAHGAQKLFGVLEGPGLDKAGAGFQSMGLTPGKPMATLAAVSEFGGGLLTAVGVADPLGPVAIAGAMVVATAVHRKGGPFSSKGGYELPLTNLALAAVLLATGPGRIRGSRSLPKRLTAAMVLGAGAMTAVSLKKLLTFTPKPAEVVAQPASTELGDVDASELAAS
jgi:putative oxidoreductase